MDPEHLTSIDGLMVNQDGEADWALANLVGGLDLDSKSSISGHYGRLREPYAGRSKSIPSSVATSLLLGISSVEVMNRAYILKGRAGPLW